MQNIITHVEPAYAENESGGLHCIQHTTNFIIINNK